MHGEMTDRGITIQYYKNEIPSFVAPELENLYESFYSALLEIKSRRNLPANIDTYVAWKSGKVQTILLLHRYKNSVRVLNEVLSLDEQVIQRFARYIFTEFSAISIISFHAIQTDLTRMEFPFQRFNTLEDIVLALPQTEEEYLARLGKATRKTIKYYANKLMRAHPSFRCQIYARGEVTKEQILAIVKMKSMRMTVKSKTAIVGEEDVDEVLGLILEYGVVGIATVDGTICAGWIGYRVGRNDFMSMSAYDMRYDDYRLGTLCCYFAIRDCIARGGAECHFQWGQDEYKFRFLGVQRDLDDVVVYRSAKDVLANPATVLHGARKKYVRKLKRWLKPLRHLQSSIASAATKFVHACSRFWPRNNEPAV